jgi:hypothetical protein
VYIKTGNAEGRVFVIRSCRQERHPLPYSTAVIQYEMDCFSSVCEKMAPSVIPHVTLLTLKTTKKRHHHEKKKIICLYVLPLFSHRKGAVFFIDFPTLSSTLFKRLFKFIQKKTTLSAIPHVTLPTLKTTKKRRNIKKI